MGQRKDAFDNTLNHIRYLTKRRMDSILSCVHCVLVARPATSLKPKRKITMKDLNLTTPETDEFEPVELGSVSEETRGGLQQDVEFASGPNSRI